eukprot:Nk52_evm49s1569 gene=Nk52_evmTU49s1569
MASLSFLSDIHFLRSIRLVCDFPIEAVKEFCLFSVNSLLVARNSLASEEESKNALAARTLGISLAESEKKREKMLSSAARKLNCGVDAVENCVNSIGFFYLECAKNDISPKKAFQLLGKSELQNLHRGESEERFLQLLEGIIEPYLHYRESLRQLTDSASFKNSLSFRRYENLQYRIDLILSSRYSRQINIPSITLFFTTHPPVSHIGPASTQVVLLDIDSPTLQHVIFKLESALKHARSAATRRALRKLAYYA